MQKFDKFEFKLREPKCLPKECPTNMEQISAFIDCYRHPNLNNKCHLFPQTVHIDHALEDIARIMNDNENLKL